MLDVRCSIVLSSIQIQHRTSNIEHPASKPMPTPTTDFTVFDAQELINWDSFLTGDDPISNIRALQRPLTQSGQRNVELYITHKATDVVFHVDATQLANR